MSAPRRSAELTEPPSSLFESDGMGVRNLFYGMMSMTVDTCLVQASAVHSQSDEPKSDDAPGPVAFIRFNGNVAKKDGAGDDSPLDSGRPYTCYAVVRNMMTNHSAKQQEQYSESTILRISSGAILGDWLRPGSGVRCADP